MLFPIIVLAVLTAIPDFNPNSVIFSPHHFGQIILSDIGVFLWVAAIAASISHFGFATTFRVYLAPYLWYVHRQFLCRCLS